MEGLLYVGSKYGGDKIEPYVFAPHAVVAEVDVAVPESLLAQHPANTTTSG